MFAQTDRFSIPLYQSPELADARRSFVDAVFRTDDPAERIAIGQDWQETMRRRRGGFVEALEHVNEQRLAIGDNCCPPGPNSTPSCTIDGRRLCDYDRVGDRDSSAGNAVFSLSPQPTSAYSWWRPKLVRCAAFDSTNPSIPRWEGLFVTSITVGGHPVEGFATAPSSAVVAGVHFGDFVVPDPIGVAVGWPDFSNDSNSNQLVFTGIGLWSANVTVLSFMTVMGNPLDARQGADRRCHKDAPPMYPIPGSSSAGGQAYGVSQANPVRPPRGL